MYEAIVKIQLLQRQFINFNSKEHVLFKIESKGIECVLYSKNNTLISESENLEIKYGEFINLATAQQEVEKLVTNLRISLSKRGIVYKINWCIQESSLTEIKMSFNMSVYDTLLIKWDMNKVDDIKFDKKAAYALNLIEMSHQTQEVEIKFLLLVMAIDTLADAVLKSPQIISYLEKLKSYVSDSNLANEDKAIINQGIANWKNEGICKSCQLMIERYCGEKEYDNLKGVDLYKQAYKLRSKFVHNGSADTSKITELVSNIGSLAMDVLEGYIRDNTK